MRATTYVRAASTDHQLLKQLRPLPLPGEVDSIDDLERAQGRRCRCMAMAKNVRDWLYVADHCAAIRLVLERDVGETYNVGGRNERNNLEVVHTVCAACSMNFRARTARSTRAKSPS